MQIGRVLPFFGRPGGPGTSPREQRKQAKRGERLRNTPVVVDKGVRLFAELCGDPAWHASRLWVVVIGQLVVNLTLGFTLYHLFPLKRVVPYIVEITSEGVVGRIVQAAAYRPESGMVKSEIGKWVKEMQMLDAYLTRPNLRHSTTFLRGKAIQLHAEFIDREKPFKRLLETPGLVREVDVKASGVDLSQQGIAFVFFSTTERSEKSEPLVRKYRLTLHYASVPPETEEEVMSNPAGLNITYFQFQELRS